MRRWALLVFAVLVAAPGALALTPERQDRVDTPDARAGAVVTGKHLTVRVSAKELTVGPGQGLTLVLDVTPGPKIHVYAPGQEGHIPVAVTLEASDDFTSTPPVFPAPRPIFYEPTAEHLKVYDEPFRLTQQLTVALTPGLARRAAAREKLTISGKLAYQACDDAVCYRPDSVPLKWEIGLTPRER